ncbi:ExeA family protein [Solidesulfovibrio carbinolicus]|uniref:General secretion pathway protein n=1 Tax=Solidesulfovibrio carbinolicus TaxID=296842 RepID=A0A4P6HPZ7_9BACT|nr:AAA family ATPase [Solidesulfovibrio carbinolicus]QAZ68846.1 general secretion pathway protein [Solidesulfovibrio carbinolicus]
MSYYLAMGLTREPFSNSPDPDMLYRSRTHLECLQHMEIGVRLRRGLNVVLGAVGAGKTTLARELTRVLGADGDIEAYLLDDPACSSTTDLLLSILTLFGLDAASMWRDPMILKEVVKAELARRSGDKGRTVALIIDEGQKITPDCLELLRELLNFETATHKLLQIVIFAQSEFEETLAARPNLDDRVNYRYRLECLNRAETARMIETRLARCAPEGETPDVFTPAALRRIHRRTGGHPRKIVRLCHLSMLLAVGFGKARVSWWLVGRAEREAAGGRSLLSRLPRWPRAPRLAVAGAACAGLVLAFSLAAPGLSGLPGLPDLSRLAQDAVSRLDALLAAPTPSAAPSSPSAPQAQALYAPELAGVVSAEPQVPARPEKPASPAADVAAAPAVSAPLAPRAASVVHALPANPTAMEGLGASLALSAAALPAEPAAAETARIGRAVAAETAAPATAAVVKASAVAPAAPETLGQSVVRSGWAVTRQAARLYGNGGRAVMARLAKANPGVNFDRVRAGDTLVFPAIAAAPLEAGQCLVRVASVASLDEGFAYLGRHAGAETNLSMYCTFSPATGLRYDIVLGSLFADRASAEAALAELPRELASRAAIVPGYGPDAVAFTDLGPWPGLRGGPKMAGPAGGSQDTKQRMVVSEAARP